MSWGAVAVAGATLVSGYMSQQSAEEQTEALKNSSNAKVLEARRQYNQTREDYEPYREAGYNALDEMQGMLGIGGESADITETPGYQFRYDEGLDALDSSLAASGNRLSGRALKAAQRYGQGMAKQEFANQYNRLAGLAGAGQSATSGTAQAGTRKSSMVGNALATRGQGVAQAQGQKYAGYNSAIQGGIGNYLSYQQNQNLLNSLGQTGTGGGGGTGGVAANVPKGR